MEFEIGYGRSKEYLDGVLAATQFAMEEMEHVKDLTGLQGQLSTLACTVEELRMALETSQLRLMVGLPKGYRVPVISR